MIEIKKKNTFKRDSKSKVFMVYALDEEAQNIDQRMHNATFERSTYYISLIVYLQELE